MFALTAMALALSSLERTRNESVLHGHTALFQLLAQPW